MEPERHQPPTPDILPAPVINPESPVAKPESYPATPEANHQPQVSPLALPAAPVSVPPAAPIQNDTSTQSQTQPVDNSSVKSGSAEELKKQYAEKARKIMSEHAADPYTETRLIEEVKQQYLRDVYHRELKLPQE